MKNKAVLHGDIDRALQKIASRDGTFQNYIFITTEAVPDEFANTRESNMMRPAVWKSPFWIASDSCGISCISFNRLRKGFSRPIPSACSA